MSNKSFLFGCLTGSVLSFIFLVIIGIVVAEMSDNVTPSTDGVVREDIIRRTRGEIKYLESPVPYENKAKVSLSINRVMGDIAIAYEIDPTGRTYLGTKEVAILGNSFYDNQVITIQNPKLIGTYSYLLETYPLIDFR